MTIGNFDMPRPSCQLTQLNSPPHEKTQPIDSANAMQAKREDAGGGGSRWGMEDRWGVLPY